MTRLIAFGYVGGKNKPGLNDWIRSHLPLDAKVYCEPFAGSLAVLLNRPPAKMELANDAAGDVVNFFRVLRDRTDELLRRLTLTPCARAEFDAAAEIIRGKVPCEDPVERARCWFVVVRQGFSGIPQHGSWSSPHPNQRTGKARTFAGKVDRMLPIVAERLRYVEFETADALDVIPRLDSPGTLFYLDPPYHGDARHTGNPRDYLEDVGDSRDLLAGLRDLLPTLQGRVALSHTPNPLWDDLGWRREDREHLYYAAARQGPGRPPRKVTESLYLNFPAGQRGLLPSSA